jgi:hypothetical protein
MMHTAGRHIALYIDPGNGTLIWQTVMAVAAGGLFRFRKFFLNMFRNKR